MYTEQHISWEKLETFPPRDCERIGQTVLAFPSVIIVGFLSVTIRYKIHRHQTEVFVVFHHVTLYFELTKEHILTHML